MVVARAGGPFLDFKTVRVGLHRPDGFFYDRDKPVSPWSVSTNFQEAS